MSHKRASKSRLPQAPPVQPVPKDHARGVVPHVQAAEIKAAAGKKPRKKGVAKTTPVPTKGSSENETLKEQFYDNDSLGG